MTVSTIASLGLGATQRANNINNKYANSIRSLVANPSAPRLDSIASPGAAAQMQTQIAGLRTASLNIAQSAGMVEVAAGGANQMSRVIGRMKELANRAGDGDLTSSDLSDLEIEFQSLKGQLNRIANTSVFKDTPVLTGKVNSELLGLEGEDGVPRLDEETLLQDKDLSVATPELAQQATPVLNEAVETLANVVADLADMQAAFEFGASIVETALQNQEASRSTLSDADLLASVNSNAQAQVNANADAARLVQTSRLPQGIMLLLSE